MIYSKLIAMIENNSSEIASKWKNRILESNFTQTYKKLSEKELMNRGKTLYQNLGKWIDGETTMKEIGKNYVELGKMRYEEGFPLCEVLYALNNTKMVLWNFLISEGFLTNAVEIYQAMELMIRVFNFFDIASFYITRGYHEILFISLTEQKNITPAKVKQLFPTGSFYYDIGPDLF